MESTNKPGKKPKDNQLEQAKVKKKEPGSTYKPFISVEKHGENGKLFDDLSYGDGYQHNGGRTYH
jgi:hypothetical protein